MRDKRDGLKTEFEMLRQRGDLDGAKLVLEKVKALNLEEQMMSSISVSTEFDAPHSATEDPNPNGRSGGWKTTSISNPNIYVYYR
jgi:hypothetical protein